VSPWKYSWKGSRLCQSRWVWKRPGVAEDRAAAVLVVEEDRNQTAGEVVGQDGLRLLAAAAHRSAHRDESAAATRQSAGDADGQRTGGSDPHHVGWGLPERLRDLFNIRGADIFGPQRMYEYLTPNAPEGARPPEGWNPAKSLRMCSRWTGCSA
jgi:hypothetical protein